MFSVRMFSVCVLKIYLSAVRMMTLFDVDLIGSDRQSEPFVSKISRARFALARTDSIRSISFSLLSKPPYRRASSFPAHLLSPRVTKAKGKVLLLIMY